MGLVLPPLFGSIQSKALKGTNEELPLAESFEFTEFLFVPLSKYSLVCKALVRFEQDFRTAWPAHKNFIAVNLL